MTKDEILNQWDWSQKSEIKQAMDIWGKQEAIGFLEWSSGRNMEISLGVFVDNFGTYESMDEYYQLYLDSKK